MNETCKAYTNSGDRCKNPAGEDGYCHLESHKAGPMEHYGLTGKQKAFAEYFAQSRNGVASAELAGYQGNYNTLRVIASENMQKPKIAQYISDLTAEAGMGAKEVINRLSGIARSSITDILDVKKNGRISVNKEKLLLNGFAVKKISIDRTKDPETDQVTEKIQVEMYPADDALKQLGRHHRLFTDRIETEDINWLIPVDPDRVDIMDPLEWVKEYKISDQSEIEPYNRNLPKKRNRNGS